MNFSMMHRPTNVKFTKYKNKISVFGVPAEGAMRFVFSGCGTV